MDASVALGGSGDEPYEALLPGGKHGEFYDEMCNYFYLAQLRAQVAILLAFRVSVVGCRLSSFGF